MFKKIDEKTGDKIFYYLLVLLLVWFGPLSLGHLEESLTLRGFIAFAFTMLFGGLLFIFSIIAISEGRFGIMIAWFWNKFLVKGEDK